MQIGNLDVTDKIVWDIPVLVKLFYSDISFLKQLNLFCFFENILFGGLHISFFHYIVEPKYIL